MKIARYFRSPSVQLGLAAGTVMYLSYGCANDAFLNPANGVISALVAAMLPYYSRVSNKAEEKCNLRTAWVTAGRAARFALQYLFNLTVFLAFTKSGVVPAANIDDVGGWAGIALVTTLASQGLQYIALVLANREIGERNRNVVIALSLNIVVTAVATMGFPAIRTGFTVLGGALGATLFLFGLVTDLLGRSKPRGGVGIFFGTFNPMHKTHLAMIRGAIEERGLSKVYVHATVIPKLHADALRKGEIEVARREGGMRVYEKTGRADVHLNYFPTGRKFYEYETRLELMRLAVSDSGLSGEVEVLSLPATYAESGFYGIVAAVRRMNPGACLHGIHGSDLGGMWVRSIYDESGVLFPYPVRRRDGVSATAIRAGEKGLTTSTVEGVLEGLKSGLDRIRAGGMIYRVEQGAMQHVEQE